MRRLMVWILLLGIVSNPFTYAYVSACGPLWLQPAQYTWCLSPLWVGLALATVAEFVALIELGPPPKKGRLNSLKETEYSLLQLAAGLELIGATPGSRIANLAASARRSANAIHSYCDSI